MAREPASQRRRFARDDDGIDSFDVPAAVLCAFCGQADCAGCVQGDDLGSGVVAIVPWERPGAGGWSRMWATANATTQGAEAFFAAIPDGPLRPAMRFALLAELLAVASMITLIVPLAALALPNLALHVAQDPEARLAALRWMGVGVPLLAGWMVLAHATHGAALDAGASWNGGRPQRRRALRFGLYACGWDLMGCPLGAAYTLFTKGWRGMVEAVRGRRRAPSRSAAALLQGVYGLRDEAADRAHRAGTIAAAVLALVSGAAVTVALVIAL